MWLSNTRQRFVMETGSFTKTATQLMHNGVIAYIRILCNTSFVSVAIGFILFPYLLTKILLTLTN